MKTYTIKMDNLYLMEDTYSVDWTAEWRFAKVYTDKKKAENEWKFLANDKGKSRVVEYNAILSDNDKKIEDESADWRVYIMSDSQGHYKIGYSKDPTRREKELQVGNPNKIRLEGWFKRKNELDAQHYEYYLHDWFEKLRLQGEWFLELNDEIKRFIKSSHQNDKTFVRYIS